MKTKLSSLVLLFLLSLNFASTDVTFKCETPQSTTVEDSIYEEDYLFLGKALDFSGEAEDVITFGETIDFSGKAKLGIISFGQNIFLSGSAGNGVIAGGENIIIDGEITGTNFIGGKSVNIKKGAKIDGDLFIGANELLINEAVSGDLYIGANLVTINSVIHGDAKIYTGRLIMGEKGRIEGNLVYTTKEALSESVKSKVGGTITEDENSCFKGDYNMPTESLANAAKVLKMVFFLSFLIAGVLILFFPAFKKLETGLSPQQFWHTALWGLIPVFMYPALIALFMVLIVPIPVAMLMLASIVPLFFMAILVGTLKLGQQLTILFKWNVQRRHYHFMIGLLATAILSIIPIIDFITFFLLISLGWGVFVSLLFNKPLGSTRDNKEEVNSDVETIA